MVVNIEDRNRPFPSSTFLPVISIEASEVIRKGIVVDGQ